MIFLNLDQFCTKQMAFKYVIEITHNGKKNRDDIRISNM